MCNGACHMSREHLAMELLDAEDRVRELAADRDGHREVARAALHRLHAAHAETTRLRAQLASLRDELRRVRTPAAPRRAA